MDRNNKLILAPEITAYDFDKPEECSEFVRLRYPRSYVNEFNKIGETEGTSGSLPICKFKKDNKEFVTYACYGTLERPNTKPSFLTFIPNKMFDRKSYEDYKEVTTQEDIDNIERSFWKYKKITIVFLDLIEGEVIITDK